MYQSNWPVFTYYFLVSAALENVCFSGVLAVMFESSTSLFKIKHSLTDDGQKCTLTIKHSLTDDGQKCTLTKFQK